MKKTISAIAIVLAIGVAFTASNSFAWNHGGHGGGHNGNATAGNHMTGYSDGANDSSGYQKFLKESESLRSGLAMDRAELDAIMINSQPDSMRARTLAGDISDKEIQLAQVARKNKVQGSNYGNHNARNCGISGHNHGFGNCW